MYVWQHKMTKNIRWQKVFFFFKYSAGLKITECPPKTVWFSFCLESLKNTAAILKLQNWKFHRFHSIGQRGYMIPSLSTWWWNLEEWPTGMSHCKASVLMLHSSHNPGMEVMHFNANKNSWTASVEVKSPQSVLPIISQTIPEAGLSWMERGLNRSLWRCDISKGLRLQSHFIPLS